MSGTEIAIVVTAVLAGALVKSITGMGLPLVSIPIMALFVPTETAVVVIAIPNATQNLLLAVRHRDAPRESRHLAIFCASGVLGAAVGALSLGLVADRVTRLVLATMVATYVVTSLFAPRVRLGERGERYGTVPVGALAGLFQGGIGISGPVVASWHHGLRLSSDAFVFSVATVFLITGVTQAAVLAARGLFDGRILVSILLTALVLSTVPIGDRLRSRLTVDTFRRLVLVLLAGSCVALVADLVA
jgi:uncharacterized membrane protein YfcA